MKWFVICCLNLKPSAIVNAFKAIFRFNMIENYKEKIRCNLKIQIVNANINCIQLYTVNTVYMEYNKL